MFLISDVAFWIWGLGLEFFADSYWGMVEEGIGMSSSGQNEDHVGPTYTDAFPIPKEARVKV